MTASGEGGEVVKGWSKQEKEHMDMEDSVVIAAGGG